MKIKEPAVTSNRRDQKGPLARRGPAAGLGVRPGALVRRSCDKSKAVSGKPQSPNGQRIRKGVRTQHGHRLPFPERWREVRGEGGSRSLHDHRDHRPGNTVAMFCCAIIAFFLQIEFAYAAGKLSRFEESQPHMGTVARIVVYASSTEAAAAATQAAFERIRELDSLLSDYQRESELNRVSHQSGGPAVKISRDLFQVLSVAQNLSVKSDGAFDVTVGPLIRLWRRARRQRALPEADRLAAALDLTGFRRLSLDAKRHTAQLVKPGMLLDLGGIAKGYAADEALKTLKRAGIERALVALGGDIAVSHPPPGKTGWTIEIASLNLAGAPRPRAPLLENAAVSTSGDAEQFVEIAGVRYSHIIDPRTGKALTGKRSVTVVAAQGIDSDALATAISVMDPKEGLKLIDATRSAAALIVVQGNSGFQTWKSKRWKD